MTKTARSGAAARRKGKTKTAPSANVRGVVARASRAPRLRPSRSQIAATTSRADAPTSAPASAQPRGVNRSVPTCSYGPPNRRHPKGSSGAHPGAPHGGAPVAPRSRSRGRARHRESRLPGRWSEHVWRRSSSAVYSRLVTGPEVRHRAVSQGPPRSPAAEPAGKLRQRRSRVVARNAGGGGGLS